MLLGFRVGSGQEKMYKHQKHQYEDKEKLIYIPFNSDFLGEKPRIFLCVDGIQTDIAIKSLPIEEKEDWRFIWLKRTRCIPYSDLAWEYINKIYGDRDLALSDFKLKLREILKGNL